VIQEDTHQHYKEAAFAKTSLIISSARGFSFGFKSGLHVFTSVIVLYMSAIGEDSVFLLNTTSLRAFQIDQSAPAHKNKVTPCLLPLHLSTITGKKESQLTGDVSHPKQSVKKDKRNTAIGHWNKM
jgi:hypothetical protein